MTLDGIIHNARMTAGEFSTDEWIDRLARALPGLAETQKPYLRRYQEQNPRVHFKSGRRDGNLPAFPLDDLRMLYARARHSHTFGEEKYYTVLCAVLDPVRHILRSHPTLARIMSQIIGKDDFWIQILGSGNLTSLTDLIGGLLARADELPGDGFRAAATELNAFLDATEEDVPNDLDVGYDVVLFHGLSLREKFAIGDDMIIVPFKQARTFVDESVLENVASTGIKYNDRWSVGAVMKPFRWKPQFRRMGGEGAPDLYRPGSFFQEAQEFLDLLAVSHGEPVVFLVAVRHCLNRSACRLLGQPHGRGSAYRGRSAHLFDPFPFPRPSKLLMETFTEARTAFEDRKSERYRTVAPIISRLAEALARDGQYAAEDKVLDLMISLERMFPPKDRGGISDQLQKSVADFLGGDDEAQSQMKEAVKHAYDVRSAIIHGPKDDKKQRLSEEKQKAFDAGFNLARQSLFKMLRDGHQRKRAREDHQH